MTWTDDEKSVEASDYVELYEFTAGSTTYRYTSYVANFDYSGNTYTKAEITRGPAKKDANSSGAELEIQMAIDVPYVLATVGAMPPRNMTVKVMRYQRVSATAETLWNGKLAGVGVKGRWATYRSAAGINDPLKTKVPRTRYQRTCNNILFDAERGGLCAAARASFRVNTTVNGAPSGNTVTVASLGAIPSVKNGEIVRTSDGERRMILKVSGLVLTLDAPFRTLSNGDAVEVYSGCDKTLETCLNSFNQVANFSGHTKVIPLNVFKIGVKGNPHI